VHRWSKDWILPQSIFFTVCSCSKVKVKLSLFFDWVRCHEGILGEWRYSSTHSLSSALDEGEWSASRPGRFTPRERPWVIIIISIVVVLLSLFSFWEEIIKWSQGISVSIVTRLCAGWVGFDCWDGLRIFSLPLCPDQLWGPLSLLFNGYQGYSPGVEQPGQEADCSL
jgi:hypothetical protein